MSNQISLYDSGLLSANALALLEKASEVTETQKQYESHYRIFKRWMKQKGVETTPTHIDLINFMADQFSGSLVTFDSDREILVDGDPISPVTIDARRWGILKLLQTEGITFSNEENKMISEYVRRLKLTVNDQQSSRRRGQAAPLRWPSVVRLIQSPRMNSTTPFQQMRDKALLCFMASTGCRESEACGAYGVRLKDFYIFSDRIDYYRVVLKGGNRDYNFRGSIGRNNNTDNDTCPYEHLKAYIEYVQSLPGSTDNTKLFLRANSLGDPMRRRNANRDLIPMGVDSIDDKLKDWAFSAGMPRQAIDLISGHSLRIGLAVDQVELGRSFEYISKITGQTIGTVERYAQQARMDPFNINDREVA